MNKLVLEAVLLVSSFRSTVVYMCQLICRRNAIVNIWSRSHKTWFSRWEECVAYHLRQLQVQVDRHVQRCSAGWSESSWLFNCFMRSHQNCCVWLIMCIYHGAYGSYSEWLASCWFFTAHFFTMRHVMQHTVLLSQFCPSVCLPVCQTRVLWQLNDAVRIFWYHTKRQSL